MDFESPDEIDRAYKKPPVKKSLESPMVESFPSKKDKILKIEEDLVKSEVVDIKRDHEYEYGATGESADSASDYDTPYENRSSINTNDSMESDSDMDTSATAANVDGGFRKLDAELEMTTQHTGDLYVDESKKRLVITDGKVVAAKSKTPTRRDKGNDSNILSPHPSDDYTSRHHRTTTTAAVSGGGKPAQQPRSTSTPHNRRLPSSAATIATLPAVAPSNSGIVQYQLGVPTVGGGGAGAVNVSPPGGGGGGGNKEQALYRVSGIKPIDVAAHLKLLGESLTIIGERLKEHEGQIAVSGSLSVLLDSLLCALGPLLCLTQQIPELQENCCEPEQLTSTLDNVAFIMPGL